MSGSLKKNSKQKPGCHNCRGINSCSKIIGPACKPTGTSTTADCSMFYHSVTKRGLVLNRLFIEKENKQC